MNGNYHNPWIPEEALNVLAGEQGRILDVGGGAAPYCRASHVLDIQPFDAARLTGNAWGQKLSSTTASWASSQYTQLDLCAGRPWPFEDRQFDLGLCSHCLEDLRDPLQVVRELSRVCKRVLIITPSRLLEQTMGIDHPGYCGFYHHPWIVFAEDGTLIFRRKTPIVNLPACHIVCPAGKTLKREYGTTVFHLGGPAAAERVFWSERDDYDDYSRFIEPYRRRKDLFVRDPCRQGLKYRVWRFRQKHLGAV